MTAVGLLTLTALWDSNDPADPLTGLKVEQADPLIAVSSHLYEAACRGELNFTLAGEGLFAIQTTTGTIRYALTGETQFGGDVLLARRLA